MTCSLLRGWLKNRVGQSKSRSSWFRAPTFPIVRRCDHRDAERLGVATHRLDSGGGETAARHFIGSPCPSAFQLAGGYGALEGPQLGSS